MKSRAHKSLTNNNIGIEDLKHRYYKHNMVRGMNKNKNQLKIMALYLNVYKVQVEMALSVNKVQV